MLLNCPDQTILAAMGYKLWEVKNSLKRRKFNKDSTIYLQLKCQKLQGADCIDLDKTGHERATP
jgi:hypothetical protein